MASVAELLPRAARLKYELEVQLRAVEQGAGDAGDCGMGLRELFTQINTLRQLLNAERPERRNLWKVKIDELGHEAQFLSNDLRRVTNFHQHQRERDSLFRRRAGAAPSSAHDDLLEAEDSYARSGNQVDELMETGRASLDSLRAQRERLKNTHRNALDMINKLGLSDTVMKLINSRNRQDRKIVVGGFVFLFVLFYLCMRWRG
ncbi:unnamed protein product [Pelagomonas calceolata]|uniref:Golgi SNAP receptor complex member 1 n=1 Tax=Pelagomonas calceolata TaxID=35677 RepID=A0A7S4A534_9STRA|nr:unnamed protein product [Pelagomonas calceolata]|mmetsp:Transcript_5286/g.15806  ORF Transcript_5286/g.15806 Transcript_5286/m.15806 type:complete len:204 (+) Transcript_5286:176-787(+)